MVSFLKERLCGAMSTTGYAYALCASVFWFWIYTQVIIPFFNSAEAAVEGYSYLNNEVYLFVKVDCSLE
ncbi:hypothetical protein [uncultured Nostoc sp.]|uniref:hypothetical protein n=1 Tax=uncultured Nostoc sp. TaxID=340711 RepID=UPI0035C9B4D7